MPKLSPYQVHAANWIHCTRCPLHRTRKKVVLARGKVPADVLFIGEAPGESEDVLGSPFIGPAGKLLDSFIEAAQVGLYAEGESPLKLCWTNLVGCIPKEFNAQRKKVEPLPAEIAACWPRLDEFIELVSPQLIIAVGELSEKQAVAQNWKKRTRVGVRAIIHPAAILRMGVEQKGLVVQRCIVNIRDAFRDVLCPF